MAERALTPPRRFMPRCGEPGEIGKVFSGFKKYPGKEDAAWARKPNLDMMDGMDAGVER